MKRFMDIFCSGIGILLLSPFILIISLLIKLTSKGPVFYKQERVGINNTSFKILKFRTMNVGADKKGLLTVGDRDPRVTKIGYYLRKTKLDELPQLFNVMYGDMSLVGPRPEVRKYVDHYGSEDMVVLSVKPGITDYASIKFRDENEMLKGVADPDKKYIEEILPIKLKLNKKYIAESSILIDINIILNTIASIFNR